MTNLVRYEEKELELLATQVTTALMRQDEGKLFELGQVVDGLVTEQKALVRDRVDYLSAEYTQEVNALFNGESVFGQIVINGDVTFNVPPTDMPENRVSNYLDGQVTVIDSGVGEFMKVIIWSVSIISSLLIIFSLTSRPPTHPITPSTPPSVLGT